MEGVGRRKEQVRATCPGTVGHRATARRAGRDNLPAPSSPLDKGTARAADLGIGPCDQVVSASHIPGMEHIDDAKAIDGLPAGTILRDCDDDPWRVERDDTSEGGVTYLRLLRGSRDLVRTPVYAMPFAPFRIVPHAA